IAHVLVEELGLIQGNRVLLRGANSPMLAACWLAVLKAGGVAVGTMPLLRAKELGDIIRIANISHALCDATLYDELDLARTHDASLAHCLLFGADGELEQRAATKPADFSAVDTAATDPALIAFTSGTT